MIQKMKYGIAIGLICLLSTANAGRKSPAIFIELVNVGKIVPLSFELTQTGDYTLKKSMNEEAGTFSATIDKKPENGTFELSVIPKNRPQFKCVYTANFSKNKVDFFSTLIGGANCQILLVEHNRYLLASDFSYR